MDIEGEYLIAAPPEDVWRELNDLGTLERCIPGCQSMTALEDNEFECLMVAKIGPIKAKFKSTITLSNVVPPSSYTLSGKGNGGAAGFGKGSADVALAPAEGGTRLNYTAQVLTGGKIAQVGARLLRSSALKLADQFFVTFKAGVEDGEAEPQA
ncbi:MAG: CoxG family protein [Gammaproteobacteria bacterium]